MKNKGLSTLLLTSFILLSDRILFAVTLDQKVAEHFALNQSSFMVLGMDNAYELNISSTSIKVLNAIHDEVEADRHATVQWIRREGELILRKFWSFLENFALLSG
jgi:hypothetical protein